MAIAEPNAVLSQRIELTPELAIIRIVPDGWELPAFESGQFATIGLPSEAPRVHYADPEDSPPKAGKLIKRAYSIASSSQQSEYLELFVTLVKSGSLTPRLFAMQPGDRLWLNHKISGMFTLAQVPDGQNIVMVATGTGLAPYMSMLRTELQCDGRGRMAILLGARHSWDLGYRSELFTIQRMCRNFFFVPTISRPDDEAVAWPGEVGYVQDLWQKGEVERGWGIAPDPANTHVFLCGNPGMIEQMIDLLATEGFREHSKTEPGQVHAEKYW